MRQFKLHEFMAAVVHHRSLLHVLSKARGPIDDASRVPMQKYADNMQRLCEESGLVIAAVMTQRIRFSPNAEACREAMSAFEQTMHAELSRRVFLATDDHFSEYFEQPALFGDEVRSAFPSANADISEAGTCLALGRGTACVMHLMRVVETGLASLASELGVPKQSDWGAYLREVNNANNARIKSAGKINSDVQFYSEVALTIDYMRRAWRNPTMHVEKSYSVEQAAEILASVRSFMAHLALRVSEKA